MNYKVLKQCTILFLWFFTYVWDNLNMADFRKTLVGLGTGIRVVVKKAEWSEVVHIEIYPIGMTRWTLLSLNHKENCVLPAPHKCATADESSCCWSYSHGQDLTPPHLHPPVSRFFTLCRYKQEGTAFSHYMKKPHNSRCCSIWNRSSYKQVIFPPPETTCTIRWHR